MKDVASVSGAHAIAHIANSTHLQSPLHTFLDPPDRLVSQQPFRPLDVKVPLLRSKVDPESSEPSLLAHQPTPSFCQGGQDESDSGRHLDMVRRDMVHASVPDGPVKVPKVERLGVGDEKGLSSDDEIRVDRGGRDRLDRICLFIRSVLALLVGLEERDSGLLVLLAAVLGIGRVSELIHLGSQDRLEIAIVLIVKTFPLTESFVCSLLGFRRLSDGS